MTSSAWPVPREPSSPPPPPPHVVVCLWGTEADGTAIERGCALAIRLESRLTLLYPFRPGAESRPGEVLARDRSLARSAGAVLIEWPVYSLAEGAVDFVIERGATHLVVAGGQPWAWLRDRSVLSDLIAATDGLEILLL